MFCSQFNSCRWALFALIVVVATPAEAGPTGLEAHQVVRVTVSTQAEAERLEALDRADRDFVIWPEGVGVGEIDVRVSPAQRKVLEATGMPFVVVIDDLQRHYDALFGGVRTGGFFATYRTYDEHVAFLEGLVAAYPDLAEMVDLGPSVQGRRLWAIRITGPGEDKPAVMYHGGQHGNEIMGPAVITYAANHLLTNYEDDPDVRAVVDGVEWFLLPIMNPDGYEAGTRRNANGVDLNRNWGGPGSRENPFSQPETAAMRDFFLAHPNTRAHIDLHSSGEMIMWPWEHAPDLPFEHWTFDRLGWTMRDLIYESRGSGYNRVGPVYRTIYPVSGGSLNYSYGELGIWAMTFELNRAHSPPSEEIIPTSIEILPTLTFLSGWIMDCNGNGIPDGEDINSGESLDCNDNQTPDECELPSDCNENGRLDLCDIRDGVSRDRDENRIPDECECPVWEFAKVGPPNPEDYHEFGHAVALTADIAVIGDPIDTDRVRFAGAAHVLRRNGGQWEMAAKLVAPDAEQYDIFGHSVAISGERIIVGAPENDDDGENSGAVYVFDSDGSQWQLHSKLVAPDGAAEAEFGTAVGVDGDVLVVGAPFDPENGLRSGAAYVFRLVDDVWSFEAKLLAQDGEEGDRFGLSLELANDALIVSAPSAGGSGAVYAFEYDGVDWVEEAVIYPHDGQDREAFGWSLALEDDVLVVGAPFRDGPRNSSGRVGVFRKVADVWQHEVDLIAHRMSGGPRFGISVAMADGTLIIGAQNWTDVIEGAGAAFVFRDRGEGWQKEAMLLSAEPIRFGGFGLPVAACGNIVLVGERAGSNDPGTAYFYRIPDCNADGVLDVCQSVGGGDWDANEVVDIEDYPGFAECLGGPEGLPSPNAPDCIDSCLAVFDFNEDLDVDLGDFAEFSMLFDS